MAKSMVSNWPMFGVGVPPNRVPGADMSVSQISDVSSISRQDNFDIIVNWTGTSPVGTLAVEISHDQLIWIPLDFSGGGLIAVPVTGNSGNHSFPINQYAGPFIRLHYVATSGVGTIFASLAMKSLSGGAG